MVIKAATLVRPVILLNPPSVGAALLVTLSKVSEDFVLSDDHALNWYFYRLPARWLPARWLPARGRLPAGRLPRRTRLRLLMPSPLQSWVAVSSLVACD